MTWCQYSFVFSFFCGEVAITFNICTKMVRKGKKIKKTEKKREKRDRNTAREVEVDVCVSVCRCVVLIFFVFQVQRQKLCCWGYVQAEINDKCKWILQRKKIESTKKSRNEICGEKFKKRTLRKESKRRSVSITCIIFRQLSVTFFHFLTQTCLIHRVGEKKRKRKEKREKRKKTISEQ